MFRSLTSISTLALLLVATVGTAEAQQRRGMDPEAALDAAMEEMTDRLVLSVEQSRQVREVLADQQTKSRALLEEARASGQGRAAMRGMRDRMREIRLESDEKILALLNDEQKIEFERMREERAERGPGRGRGGP